MGSLRALKRRINISKNIAKITKAMQMVSASKMKRAEEQVTQAIPYAEGIYEIVSKLGNIRGYKSIYLKKPKKIKNILIIIVGPSRGFVGDLTSRLIVELSNNIEKIKRNYPDVKMVGLSIHKQGLKIATTVGIEPRYHFATYFESPNTTTLSPIYKVVLDGYKSGFFNEVYISFAHFVNSIVQVPKFKRVLPITFEESLSEQKSNDKESIEKQENDFIFEPDMSKVLDFLLPEYFETQILTAILDSNASEHAARMVAMKNATDNAQELVKTLTHEYNKTRQSEITKEILEVAAGANESLLH